MTDPDEMSHIEVDGELWAIDPSTAGLIEKLIDEDDRAVQLSKLTLAGQLIESHDGDVAAAIGDVLRDENALAPTPGAVDVLVTVIRTFTLTDTRWGERGLSGSPSATDYAADAIDMLRRRFSGSGLLP